MDSESLADVLNSVEWGCGSHKQSFPSPSIGDTASCLGGRGDDDDCSDAVSVAVDSRGHESGDVAADEPTGGHPAVTLPLIDFRSTYEPRWSTLLGWWVSLLSQVLSWRCGNVVPHGTYVRRVDQGLASMPRDSIEDALDELRSHRRTSRQAPLYVFFAHMVRTCRRFHDVVHPSSTAPRSSHRVSPNRPRRTPATAAAASPGAAPMNTDAPGHPVGVATAPTVPVQPPPPTAPSARCPTQPTCARLRLWIQQLQRWQNNDCTPRLAWRAVGVFATPATVRATATFVAEPARVTSPLCQVVPWPSAQRFVLEPFQQAVAHAMTAAGVRDSKSKDALLLVPLAECEATGFPLADGAEHMRA